MFRPRTHWTGSRLITECTCRTALLESEREQGVPVELQEADREEGVPVKEVEDDREQGVPVRLQEADGEEGHQAPVRTGRTRRALMEKRTRGGRSETSD